jgi:hypothetical protein
MRRQKKKIVALGGTRTHDLRCPPHYCPSQVYETFALPAELLGLYFPVGLSHVITLAQVSKPVIVVVGPEKLPENG